MELKKLALAVVVMGLMAAPVALAEKGSDGCALKGAAKAVKAGSLRGYTDEELTIIRYIADRLEAGDPPRFSAAEIQEATGVSADALEELSKVRLEQGLITEMNRRGVDIAGCAGNCARFSACSIDRDLSGASGEELARYEAEKKQDGESFDGWTAPGFTLPSTTGETVTLADYREKAVALVFLSGHCNHSMGTLPVLVDLAGQYEARGLQIVPVYINSGSVDDVRSWSASLGVEMPLLVAEPRDLADAYDFRMVPTTFLIDEDGFVVKKLVGQKDRETLAGAFGGLIGEEIAAKATAD